MVTTLQISELSGTLVAAARAKGFEYEMHTNFSEIMAVCEAMGKSYNTKLIDPQFNDFTRANCFWFLVRHEGQPIACIGARMDVLARGELLGFLDRQYARVYFGRGSEAIRQDISPPIFREIEGSTVYLGDLFVKQEYRGGRSGFDLRQMILLAQTTAFTEWNFDWLYAFIRDEHAANGYSALYRAAHQYPASVRWKEKSALRADADWFVCSHKEDMHYIIEVELGALRQSPSKS